VVKSLTDPGILTVRGFFVTPRGANPNRKKSPKSPDFSITISRTVFAENPLKFPYDTYNSPKSNEIPKNIDVLSKNNF
jgi:hypothetical protein